MAFSFIDGMHLAEFVVRDFANVEHVADWTSVIVFDDILPRTAEEAARDRRTRAWTGDVFKALAALERHRPDLICLRVDTEPTGLGVILGLDPLDRTLREHYDAIVAESGHPRSAGRPRPRAGARRRGRPAARARQRRLGPAAAGARAGDVAAARHPRLRRAVRKDLGVDVPRPRLVDLATA